MAGNVATAGGIDVRPTLATAKQPEPDLIHYSLALKKPMPDADSVSFQEIYKSKLTAVRQRATADIGCLITFKRSSLPVA